MKKLFAFITISSMLSSCAIYQQTTTTNIANYITLEERGVYATESNSIPYDYRPIGSITSMTQASKYDGLNVGTAFAEIAEKVTLNGGNGIINLNINISSSKDVHYMTVTGMAVLITDQTIIEYLNRRLGKSHKRKELYKTYSDPSKNPHLQKYK